jgi:hypothetical protein
MRTHPITSSEMANSGAGHGNAERLGGLELDDELVLGRLLHRQVAPLGAVCDAIDIAGRPRVDIELTDSVGHQATCLPPTSQGPRRSLWVKMSLASHVWT